VTPLHQSRPQRVAAVVVLASLGAIGFLPLFGGPGYEHAVASGLVVPSAAAIATALELAALPCPAPLGCAARGLASGVALAGLAYLTAIAHGLRAGMCDFLGGSLLFALTAGMGALLGGIWGAFVSEIARRQRTALRRRIACVLLGLAAPLLGIAVSVWRFFASPMIFAYDPFFGYFSGALYDTVVDVRAELWTYRAGTVAAMAGYVLVAAAFVRGKAGDLDFRRGLLVPRARACLACGIALLASAVAVAANGPRLGHWQTAATIARALGGRASGPRCDVVYPDSLLPDQVALLVRDCEEELSADERRLGTHLEGRLTAFEFESTEQKRLLMGAADTSIAKPWRREVYVQVSPYPHPVLGHEIAHVVAGTFAHGPFHVGGGVVPNPGLIEGIAVATSPGDGELTDAEWARAMLDAGILPSLRDLFSLDFFGQNASKSYTVAGAVIGWALDRWGPETVRAWYGGGSVEALTGLSWEALDDEFRGWLRSLVMPAEATAYAKAIFERPSVWARKCPHAVDALHRSADRCRDERRFDRAMADYGAALALDPEDWHALLERGRIATHYGDEGEGRAALRRLASEGNVPRTWRDRAEEAAADDDLLRGRLDEAEEAYRRIAAHTLDEDAARTLEVKAIAARDERARQAVVDLLVGSPGRPVDPWVGALSMGLWAGPPAGSSAEPPGAASAEVPRAAGPADDGLAEYLVGKNLMLHDDFLRAAAFLDRALGAGARTPPITPRIGRELLRTRAVCACALRDGSGLAEIVRLVLAPESPFADRGGGRRDWLLRLIDRCGASGG
jgi:tetratricopeptide (TPR) repeat protein